MHASYPLTVDPLVWIEQRVTTSDEAAYNYGASVAISGKTALIGAPAAEVDGVYSGAAYVFSESKGVWAETAKLAGTQGGSPDSLGTSVALDRTTAVVGAPFATVNGNIQQGVAYVFSDINGTWVQVAQLTANDGAAHDEFGYSVAISGSTVLVGAYQAVINGNEDQGAAYVFGALNGTWTQISKLIANDGSEDSDFGYSVALSGTTALVGAPRASFNNNTYQGVAYVFSASSGTWLQTAEFSANDGKAADLFGESVALSGTTALVGAPQIVSIYAQQGAAYVFRESNDDWMQAAKLVAKGVSTLNSFGSSVALDGTTALVGAIDAKVGGVKTGAAYVFSQSDGIWAQTAELTESDGAPFDELGKSVAYSGLTALVGASFATVDGHPNHGAAYFYATGDLGLALSTPGKVLSGDSYLSQTIVTNSSSVASPAVTMSVAVPAAASFVSATATQGSCNEASGVVTCAVGQIAGNAGTAKVNVKLKAPATAAALVNAASIVNATPPLTTSAETQVVNDTAPVASDGTLTTNEDTAASGTLKATDADGNPLTFSIVSQPAHGKVVLADASKGSYTYTPDKGYSGSDSFSFKANDGILDSNVSTINITVKAVAPPPPSPPSPSGGGGGGAFGGLALLALLGLMFAGFAVKLRRG